MDPIANKSTKIIFSIFIVLALASIAFTYCRYMIKEDFTIIQEEI